jgi:uncharacterized protein YbaR (Trm112 family)
MESASACILCCPQCTALLETSSEHEGLDCTGCSLTFPIRNGVPVLVIGEATVRPIPTDSEFDQLINQALAAPFHGWDLSWLESRKTTTFVSADNPMQMYDARAAVLVTQCTAVLDLGTGDGNRFAAYAPFPGLASATESYAPIGLSTPGPPPITTSQQLSTSCFTCRGASSTSMSNAIESDCLLSIAACKPKVAFARAGTRG